MDGRMNIRVRTSNTIQANKTVYYQTHVLRLPTEYLGTFGNHDKDSAEENCT